MRAPARPDAGGAGEPRPARARRDDPPARGEARPAHVGRDDPPAGGEARPAHVRRDDPPAGGEARPGHVRRDDPSTAGEPPPALVRLGVRVRGDRAEMALAALLDLLPGGLEERAMGDDVEYATYAAPEALPDEAAVRAAVGAPLVAISREPVPEDWARRWHAFLGPVTVAEGGRSLTVRPPWVPGEDGDLVVAPDALFGAGTHPTTRLVLRLLLAEPRPAGALCDWGAGTGVLAVAAARLGWSPVTAVELDAGAAAVIAANAVANGVAVDTRRGDLTAEEPPWAPTVCANLFAPLLVRLAGSLERPPRRLLASGVLDAEADAVAAAWAARGLREARRLEEEGWAALLLERR